MMNRLFIYLFTLATLVVTACNQQEGVEAKKNQLKDYRNEVKELQSKIATLEEEIATEDPDYAVVNKNATLVTTLPIKTDTFSHYIKVSGNVASDKNVTVNAEASAEVSQVKVKKGDQVRKGQVLIVQDAETTRRNIAELETSLELASTRFERQSNLWEQEIGTEMQYLEAKNNMESIERRLASAQSQLNNYMVIAPFSGTIDQVFVKEGEVTMPGVPILRLVSLEDMYVEAEISETYLGEFNQGDPVTVRFPSLNKSIQATISSIGQVINENNRTFEVQVQMPEEASVLRPNLLAVLEIKNFEQADAVIIPTNLIQSDNRGDYVFVAKETENGLVAEKKRVERGMTYDNQTMIVTGLEQGILLIDEGAREVAEGAFVKVNDQNEVSTAVSSK
ncbi:efflux RND transporter periplasmic adaptor subunit [Catalinimonas niigatensis]|uniref:efflux RND transporter periplasmic adaptor subunit n=1 Tax=Catalinimonas niigatensis TaxID=1397264 RepID=UPI0026659CEE|nr:efflux RND transporter periplasmic adaptor subunit [Catalinimonas niigatensis]WPP49909.1 efflux RND transporter periplasmic adaptor subunit [Catalinimonas niigatensis]